MTTSDDNSSKPNSVAKYAGVGVQMALTLGLAVWGGIKLDEYLKVKALFVIVFPLIALAMSMYQLARELAPKKKKKDE